MKFVFNGKYAPLTDGIAFIDAPIEDVLDDIIKRSENKLKIKTKTIKVTTCFEDLLMNSLPFFYPSKEIIFETKSKRIGYIQNGFRTEVHNADSIASRLNVKVIAGEAWLSNYGKTINGWGGGTFSYMEKGRFIRHLMLSDQDRWQFDQSGEPFPFEDLEKYKEKFARNRFTPEMLDKYLKEFGIDFFNEDFYMPPGSKAYIIEQIRDPYPNEVPTTLEARRKELNYF